MKYSFPYRGWILTVEKGCYGGFYCRSHRQGTDPTLAIGVFDISKETAIKQVIDDLNCRITMERVTLWDEILRIEGKPPWIWCPEDPHRAQAA